MRGVARRPAAAGAGSSRMTCSASLSPVSSVSIKAARFSAQVPDRESRDARRAGRPRQHRRLHQPLKVERHVISSLARAADDIGPGAASGSSSATTRSRTVTKSRMDRCFASTSQSMRAPGSAARSAAAGIAWIMSPSAPRRTIRTFITTAAPRAALESVVASFWVIGGDAGEEIAGCRFFGSPTIAIRPP